MLMLLLLWVRVWVLLVLLMLLMLLVIWWNGEVGMRWKTMSGSTPRLTGDSATHGGGRHAPGFYWARLLELRVMGCTTWWRRIVVFKFARDPCPRGMRPLVLVLARTCVVRCWLPIYGRKLVMPTWEDKRRRCVLDVHVRKTQSVICDLRVPIGSLGLLLHLRRVIVLRGDAPTSRNAPANLTWRGIRSVGGLRIAHASGRCGVHPPAILPLLHIHSRGSWWHKGRVRDWMGDWNRRSILHCRDDGGRGPG
jgi:hypothetical protein